MKLNVKYFASIRELVGVSTQVFDTQAQTLGALRDELSAGGCTRRRAGPGPRGAHGPQSNHER